MIKKKGAYIKPRKNPNSFNGNKEYFILSVMLLHTQVLKIHDCSHNSSFLHNGLAITDSECSENKGYNSNNDNDCYQNNNYLKHKNNLTYPYLIQQVGLHAGKRI